jgi:hypothetical protein
VLVFTWFSGYARDAIHEVRARSRGRVRVRAEHVELVVEPEQGGTRFRVRHRCPGASAIHVAQAWGFLKASLKAYLEAGFDVRGTAPEG